MSFLTAAAALLGAGITLWGSYYLLVGLMSWRRPMEYGRHPASTRFAVLVPARNEELVVGSLINTLLMQDYPPELYDIWVVPNQCTDHTALAARRFGAHVLECTVPVKSKGEVLRFAWERLAHRGYDAVCVFDADNLADPQFLREMNNAYRAGARVAQGFRDSKNPYDSVVSGCYSIYYWMMDRLHNGGRPAGPARHDQRHRLYGGRFRPEANGRLADGDHQRGSGAVSPVRPGGGPGLLGPQGGHL